jgi:hypothetical protein
LHGCVFPSYYFVLFCFDCYFSVRAVLLGQAESILHNAHKLLKLGEFSAFG